MQVLYAETRMNENNYPGLKSCNILLWILLIAPFMLLRYSESATCNVNNCVSSKCSGMTCDTCNDGYYLFLGVCTKCFYGCSTCTHFLKCTACADNFYLQSGQCHRCSYGCFTCTNSKTCTTCADKFYHISGKCHRCSYGCFTCTNSKTCAACADNFYLQSGDCHRCSYRCDTCSSYKTCTACPDKFYLQSGECHRCSNECSTCTSSNTCTACPDKFYLQSGECYLCPRRCATCTGSKTCKACADNYYLTSGECYLCPRRCATCTSHKTCTACADPYWNLLGQCSSPCSTNCTDSRCDDTTGLCYDCKPGKYGQHCEHDCNLCREGQCGLRQCTNGCKDGYYQGYTVSGNSYCLTCAQDNCVTCSNGTYCTQCKHGYYRQETSTDVMSCLPCYGFCLKCKSTELCPADCVQHCSDPDNRRNTKSTQKITITTSSSPATSSSPHAQHTSTLKISETVKSTELTPNHAPSTFSSSSAQHTSTLKISETVKSTEVTTHGARPTENAESHKEIDKFLQQGKTSIDGEDPNQLTFGQGVATGTGIALVVVLAICGVLVVCIRRRTNLDKQCCGLPDDHDDSQHHYVNTNMSVTRPGHNEVEVHNVIRTVPSASTNSGATNCNQAYYSNYEYVCLGVRSPSESYYADLQNTQRSGM